MEIILNKDDLKDFIKNEYFIEALARELIKMKKNDEWANEFDRQLLEAFKKAQKEIVGEYVNEYYEGDISSRVSQALGSLTKEEILKYLVQCQNT
jgi:hypothetical protein